MKHERITPGMPAEYLEEAVTLLSHPDAQSYALDLVYFDGLGFSARIYPPKRRHLYFTGTGQTPRQAVDDAVRDYQESRI